MILARDFRYWENSNELSDRSEPGREWAAAGTGGKGNSNIAPPTDAGAVTKVMTDALVAMGAWLSLRSLLYSSDTEPNDAIELGRLSSSAMRFFCLLRITRKAKATAKVTRKTVTIVPTMAAIFALKTNRSERNIYGNDWRTYGAIGVGALPGTSTVGLITSVTVDTTPFGKVVSQVLVTGAVIVNEFPKWSVTT